MERSGRIKNSARLRAGRPELVYPQGEEPLREEEELHSEVEVPHRILKLLCVCFSFFIAGTNDGSIKVLIYLLQTYRMTTATTAALYLVTSFIGIVLAVIVNQSAEILFDLGTHLTIGAALQLLSQAMRVWKPTYYSIAASFFINGLGQAYQNTHAHMFITAVRDGHRWTSIMVAMYILGIIASPFIVNAVTWESYGSENGLLRVTLSGINLCFVKFSFQDSLT
ncbi:hypothetical protein F5884DRAFT_755807 [Xylogone sp. PMI_703]|nr:hypothetical protein F5884DRAFT_755807 [Xylogone sp. PMI_703]